ncbi:hypothetical protein niasHT_015458 [Heterodera trifolii]|uniref:Uncharacterized protein n=1 Tax=Heterodera trifolii TaxID=157864 RepID=A0ABD2L0C0_9BILA
MALFLSSSSSSSSHCPSFFFLFPHLHPSNGITESVGCPGDPLKNQRMRGQMRTIPSPRTFALCELPSEWIWTGSTCPSFGMQIWAGKKGIRGGGGAKMGRMVRDGKRCEEMGGSRTGLGGTGSGTE